MFKKLGLTAVGILLAGFILLISAMNSDESNRSTTSQPEMFSVTYLVLENVEEDKNTGGVYLSGTYNNLTRVSKHINKEYARGRDFTEFKGDLIAVEQAGEESHTINVYRATLVEPNGDPGNG